MPPPTTSKKLWLTLKWLPAYLRQRMVRRLSTSGNLHLIFAMADHFEPCILPGAPQQAAEREVQLARLERWCREYPRALDAFRDSDGCRFRHTFFYPAEEYDEEIISRIAEHCRAGWGELEIHLHHGIKQPDTPENTRRALLEYRELLVGHGCLSRLDGSGPARFAFVHGNWALANSAEGRFCGVDEEMKILAETGCYADFTMPSAPNPAQVSKINSLYECALPLEQRAPHRRGHDLRRGRPPQIFPLIVQGPLMLIFWKRRNGLPLPGIENSEVSGANPATRARLRLWKQAAVCVQDRPDWVFIKLHCHGMDPRDDAAMFGAPMQQFLQDLKEGERNGEDCELHFTTAREMVNIILAACDGKEGNPRDFRDYRFKLITPVRIS
jgi:hypothetical protein